MLSPLGNTDDAYWGGDLNIPEPRPSYQINDTNPGTDAAAAASAAFSACSILYSNSTPAILSSSSIYPGRASLQNASYASTLLSHAQSLYSFAVNATGGMMMYQNSVPEVANAYASSSYGDDLALAALLLAQATHDSSYYQDAWQYYVKYQLAGLDDVFNWDSKSPALPVMFAQLTQGGITSNYSGWQSASEAYFDRIVDGTGRSYLTSGGLLYYPGDSTDASLNPALNAAMLMLRYAPMASSSQKTQTYQVC
jgi:endoglucanase